MSSFKSGDKIGKYKMVELIGHGGMASVYLGMDEDLERSVAIKVLHPHLENRQEAKERFRREAKAIAKISHPNIVEIYDYSGEEARQSFIVTQLVSGGNIKDLKDKIGDFPAEIAASIAIQVAQGLRVAHSNGVVHRDIKPENLLLDRDGTVKIADFGIAHLADAHDMTATGQILGSPYYMSPEQVLGDFLDERSDIFSFGSLMFWLSTGKAAFDGANPHAVLRSIVDKDIEEVDRLSPVIGKKLGLVIQRCLKKNPDERFSSFSPIIKELEDYLGLSGVDDVHAELREFISSTESYRETRTRKSIETWSQKALDFEQKGEIQEAMDLYNRVLALDPDNERVLSRLKKVRTAQSRKKAMRWTLSVVLIFALLGGGVLLGTTLFPEKPGKMGDESNNASGVLPPWKKISSHNIDPGELNEASEGSGGSGTAKKVSTSGKKGKSHLGLSSAAGKKAGGDEKTSKIRKVRFVPFPKTVNIFIDGVLLGSYFKHQETSLSVGEHKIKFEPVDKECCESAEWTVNILAAKDQNKVQLIGKRLVFRPASLFVFSDKPADVLVGGSKLGRTGAFLEISLGDKPSKTVEVTVSREGCDVWSSKVILRAGKKTNLKAKLACQ